MVDKNSDVNSYKDQNKMSLHCAVEKEIVKCR